MIFLVLPLLYVAIIFKNYLYCEEPCSKCLLSRIFQVPELTKYWLILSQRFLHFFRKLLLFLYNFAFKWITRLWGSRKIVIKNTHTDLIKITLMAGMMSAAFYRFFLSEIWGHQYWFRKLHHSILNELETFPFSPLSASIKRRCSFRE